MKDVPLGFLAQPKRGGALTEVKVAPPEDHDVFCVRGLWISAEPFAIQLHGVYVGETTGNLIPGIVDASAFDAAPRQDGWPRHVALPAGEITKKRPLILAVTTFLTPAVIPYLIGHVVGKWLKGGPTP